MRAYPTKTSQKRRDNSRLLDWVLSRQGRVVSCTVDSLDDCYRFTVSTIGQEDHLLEQTFDSSVSAFQSHSAVVNELRDSGWRLVEYR